MLSLLRRSLVLLPLSEKLFTKILPGVTTVSSVVVSVMSPVFPAKSVTLMVAVSGPSAKVDRFCAATCTLPLASTRISALLTVSELPRLSLMIMLLTKLPMATCPVSITIVASCPLTSASPPSSNLRLFSPSLLVGAVWSMMSGPVLLVLLPAKSVAVTVTITVPSPNGGKVLSASVHVPSPLLVAG